MTDRTSYRYDAFLSYRHAEPDRAWAKWLHRALETFRTPRPLIDKGCPPRIQRVFRDEEELPASADLSREIDEALRSSRFLIVICSPRTPASSWVNQEVVRFREMGRHDRILALLIEGEPSEAFPPALCEIRTSVVDREGHVVESIEEVEPLAADVRLSRDEPPRVLKRMARLRFAAALLGCRFDDLRQREQERRTRRFAWLSVGALVLVGLLAALAAVAVSQGRRADARAEEAHARMLRSYVELGRSELLRERPLRAAPYLAEAYAQGEDGVAVRHLLAQACRALDGTIATLRGHEDQVWDVSWSPDGARLASASADATARVWDASTGGVHAVLRGHELDVWSAAFSPDASQVLTESADGTARLWDAESGHCLHVWNGTTREGGGAAFGPDGARVLVGGEDGAARIYDAATGARLLVLSGHEESVRSVAFSPDGRVVATAGGDGTARLWSAASGEALAVLDTQVPARELVAFSPDGTRLLTTLGGDAFRIWEVPTGEPLCDLQGHSETVSSGSFDPAGRRVLTAGNDGTARVWDVLTGFQTAHVRRLEGSFRSVVFHPDGERIVCVHDDGGASVWATAPVQRLEDLRGHTRQVTRAAVDPGGSCVATSSRDGTVRLWDVERHPGRRVLPGRTMFSSVSSACYSPDGDRVVLVGDEPSATLWDVASGSLVSTLAGDVGRTRSCAFSREGASVMVGGADGKARLWDARTCDPLSTCQGHTSEVRAVAFSPDGRWVVTGSEDTTARVWSATMGVEHVVFRGHEGPVVVAGFTRDGAHVVTVDTEGSTCCWEATTGVEVARLSGLYLDEWLARDADLRPAVMRLLTRSADRELKVWDPQRACLLTTLSLRHADVLAFGFGPDGSTLGLAYGDLTTQVVDVPSGRMRALFEGHDSAISCLAFSADGLRLVTGSEDYTARVWDAVTGGWIATLSGHENTITRARFGPHGRTLLTLCLDGSACLWDVAPETRSPTEIQALLEAKCPYELVEGRLETRAPGGSE